MDYKIQALNGFQLYADQLITVFRCFYESENVSLDQLTEITGMNRRKTRLLLNFLADLGLSEKRILTKTELGKLIFEQDSFLQDEGTLWLFHYLIATNEYIIVWNRILNELYRVKDFSQEELYPLFQDLKGEVSDYSYKKHIHQEVATVIKTYTENLFSKLGLIEGNYDNRYKVNNNIEIDEAIVMAAIYEYREKFMKGATALSIPELIEGKNGVAHIFAMDEYLFRVKLENMKNMGWITIESRGNLDQIRFGEDRGLVDVMTDYYQNRR